MIQAGRLNRRITLQRESIERSDMGGAQRRYTDTATVWAKVQNLRGREIDESEKVTPVIQIKITIRYRKDVTEKWRIRMQDPRGQRFFSIGAIINPEDGRRELQLSCIELPSGEPV